MDRKTSICSCWQRDLQYCMVNYVPRPEVMRESRPQNFQMFRRLILAVCSACMRISQGVRCYISDSQSTIVRI